SLSLSDSVRLMDGGSRCAGRVEVLRDGKWGTVCGSAWDMKDAAVVCRELQCGEPVDLRYWAEFGRGSGPIWIYDLYCRGSELTINNCSSQGGHVCDHVIDAGVICSGWNSRLTAGPHRCSGRVEVLHGGSWSTVCDGDFDQQDAEVFCRELDCGIPVKVLGSAAFGRGEGQVWTEELQCKGNESEIYFCPSSSLKHSNCTHHNDVGLICSDARLVNGSDSCSGRVELQYLSEWGTVCAVGWDMRAADVLCAQLDCGSAVAVVEVDWFVEGSGHIWANVFDCQGNETHLSQCGISSWSRAACSHKHDAGVICNGSSMAFHEGRVRLSGGSECQGEVEIYFRQDWRKVLLDSWSLSEASVLCRQLGCGSVLNYRSSPSTTEHKHMCVTAFSCSGSEAHLGNCSSAQAVNCTSGEHLYITCSGKHHFTAQQLKEFFEEAATRLPPHRPWECAGGQATKSVRLVDGGSRCAGRVEVLRDGQWGTVCGSAWDMKDAAVVCRELQCGEPVDVRYWAEFGRGSGPIWIYDLYCRGSELTINNCSSQAGHICDHVIDAGVICSAPSSIRLVGSGGDCAGRLEVFHSGSWGAVCDDSWGIEDADVVCRQLQCGRALSTHTPAWFGPGTGSIWQNEVECEGNETSLWNCRFQLCEKGECGHQEDVGVVCSEHWSLRLSGGKGSCSGRLEVYHNATWGSVCDDQWNISNAQVVCRQLGCGSALSADRFGLGEGTVWLNRVKCRGDEIHLWDCHHSLKKHTDCSH
ncbi:scavenger receptor cysteine-rich type 1 protein M130, partial [Silurus meridionalis]